MELVVTKNFGNPESWTLESYRKAGGYQALEKVLNEMTPEDVSELVKESGLSGRGGAFFPTGLKWQFVRSDPKTPRYVVINGDESEPGTYVNRYSLELDPHLMLEGMLIAAYACNATLGYVYIRGEYGLGHERTQAAIREAYEAGYLGQSIMGKEGFDFEVTFRRGPGPTSWARRPRCSIRWKASAGTRATSRRSRPTWAFGGCRRRSTTWRRCRRRRRSSRTGPNGSRTWGTARRPARRCIASRAAWPSPGVHELPLGTTARELIYDYGGGVLDGRPLKGFKPGGASSAALGPEHLDAPLEPRSMAELGTIMGTGGVVVYDDTVCMVDAAYRDALFFEEESCGFCIPCREGTPNLVQILERILHGQGTMDDLDLLEDLGASMMSSFCGLGQFAHQPVRGAVRAFRDEFEAYILGR